MIKRSPPSSIVELILRDDQKSCKYDSDKRMRRYQDVLKEVAKGREKERQGVPIDKKGKCEFKQGRGVDKKIDIVYLLRVMQKEEALPFSQQGRPRAKRSAL